MNHNESVLQVPFQDHKSRVDWLYRALAFAQHAQSCRHFAKVERRGFEHVDAYLREAREWERMALSEKP